MNLTAEERAAMGSHVGYCQTCGHLDAAAVDDRSTKQAINRTARWVAQLVREGRRTGYMTVAEVRAAKWCDCPRRAAEGQP